MDVYQIAEIPSNNVVTNKDVERLTQNRWLNDTCMNAITHLISLDFPRVKTDSSPCYHVMDTAFFTLLTGIDGEKAYDHHAIKGFTQNTKMAYAPFDCQKIFVPLNIDNMHWALLIVELFPPDRVNLYTYDSLNVVRNVHENITQWVHDEVRARPQWDAEELQIQSIVMHVSQRQTNSYDCGMYVCAAIQDIAAQRAPESSPDDIRKLRRKFASDIEKYRGDEIYRLMKHLQW